MFFKIVALFAALAVASATQVQQCEDGSPTPIEVRIDGCDLPPCDVMLGDTIHIEADGIASMELDNLFISVISTRPDGTVTVVPIPDNEACNLIVDGMCPVAAGTEITFASDIFANPIFPPGETTLEVRLTMGANTLTCFRGDINLME